MKKFAVLLLALSLLCGVLTGCASDKGNIDDTDGVVTDSPRDDDNGVIDDMLDDDDNAGNNGNSGNNGDDGNKDTKGDASNKSGNQNGSSVPTSIPGESPAVATQPVTP